MASRAAGIEMLSRRALMNFGAAVAAGVLSFAKKPNAKIIERSRCTGKPMIFDHVSIDPAGRISVGVVFPGIPFEPSTPARTLSFGSDDVAS